MPLNWPYLKHNANSVSDQVPCLDLFLPNGAVSHIQTHDFLASMPSWHVQCAPSHLQYDNNTIKPGHYMLLGQTEAPKLRTMPRQQVLTWNFSVWTCPHPSVASSPLSPSGKFWMPIPMARFLDSTSSKSLFCVYTSQGSYPSKCTAIVHKPGIFKCSSRSLSYSTKTYTYC